MTKEMTKDEMAKMIENLTKTNEDLIKNQNVTVKTKVQNLIEDGINTIEEISEKLLISSKNVSSNLTAIRNDLKESGKTIVSQRIEKKTMLAIVNLADLNW